MMISFFRIRIAALILVAVFAVVSAYQIRWLVGALVEMQERVELLFIAVGSLDAELSGHSEMSSGAVISINQRFEGLERRLRALETKE
jgi:hypothetical protein